MRILDGYILRDMKSDEIANYELVMKDADLLDKAEVARVAAQAAAKASAQAKLAALGLTADEIAAL